MNLESLEKLQRRSSKRLGRGLGSGKGKTVGRGTKGQKARDSISQGFIGGTLPLYRKLPLRRGQGNSKAAANPIVIDIALLNDLKTGSIIDMDLLAEKKIISKKDFKKGVKILGNTPLKVALTVKIPTSKSARGAIEQAGGKVENA